MPSEIRLIPMTAEMYHRYALEFENDPDLCPDKEKYVPYVYSRERAQSYLQRQHDLNRVFLAIMLDNDIVGEIILKKITARRCATMSITLKNASYKDRGIGTEAEKLAVRYAFDTLDIPTLYADSLQTNTRSRHVLEKAGFQFMRQDSDFRYYRIDRDCIIKHMETEEEIRGKAYVHWRGWHDTCSGLVSQTYLDGMTLEKCEMIAFRWPDHLLIAKDQNRVIGFLGYGVPGPETPETGTIFSLYVLSEYQGKGIGRLLMGAGLDQLSSRTSVCLWVLKGNRKAIRFYEQCGFIPDGEEKFDPSIAAEEIRMVRKRTSPC